MCYARKGRPAGRGWVCVAPILCLEARFCVLLLLARPNETPPPLLMRVCSHGVVFAQGQDSAAPGGARRRWTPLASRRRTRTRESRAGLLFNVCLFFRSCLLVEFCPAHAL